MICGTFTMSSIPDGQEDTYVSAYESNVPPPSSVTKTQAADKTWTVTATWPACPAGTTVTHSTTGATPAGA